MGNFRGVNAVAAATCVVRRVESANPADMQARGQAAIAELAALGGFVMGNLSGAGDGNTFMLTIAGGPDAPPAPNGLALEVYSAGSAAELQLAKQRALAALGPTAILLGCAEDGAGRGRVWMGALAYYLAVD